MYVGEEKMAVRYAASAEETGGRRRVLVGGRYRHCCESHLEIMGRRNVLYRRLELNCVGELVKVSAAWSQGTAATWWSRSSDLAQGLAQTECALNRF
jgi:hypothetical protein